MIKYTLPQKKLINLMIKLDFVLIEYEKILKEIKVYAKNKEEDKLLELNEKLKQKHKEIYNIKQLLKKIS